MGQEMGHSDTAAGEWTDTARYRALITIDRRRWAWLWLKRNLNYQAAARRVAETTSWQSLGPAAFRLISDDLNDLFQKGYLSISAERAMAGEIPGCSGIRTSIRPSLSRKPNRYPHHTPMPSTSLVSAIRPSSFRTVAAANSSS